jgi:integrase
MSNLDPDRHGKRLTGNAVRKLFERLKTRTAIRDLCAHMLRHTLGDELPPLAIDPSRTRRGP